MDTQKEFIGTVIFMKASGSKKCLKETNYILNSMIQPMHLSPKKLYGIHLLSKLLSKNKRTKKKIILNYEYIFKYLHLTEAVIHRIQIIS